MDHQERGDELEAQADKLAEERRRVDEDIDEARRDWEAKKSDSSVPGAVEDESSEGGEEEEPDEPPRSDEQSEAGQ